MTRIVLDASYALTWCFADRATEKGDACLGRIESGDLEAIVPPIWDLEIGNVLGKAVVRRKISQ